MSLDLLLFGNVLSSGVMDKKFIQRRGASVECILLNRMFLWEAKQEETELYGEFDIIF